MEPKKWEDTKVYGRDEVLRDIERRANSYSERVVEDVRTMMNDYEVDIYRIILAMGERYGMDTAYEIMSDTVTEKRIKWLDQMADEFSPGGTDLEKGLDLFIKYFKPKEGEYEIIEKTDNKIVLKRKEFVNALSHTCKVLGLDVIEVNNKVYARATNFMFERINPKLKHVILGYADGWYEEKIELT